MNLRDIIEEKIVEILVESKLGTNRPFTKGGDSEEGVGKIHQARPETETKPFDPKDVKAGPRDGSGKRYGLRVMRLIKQRELQQKKGIKVEPEDSED